MEQICSPEFCTGCAACFNICPRNAVAMLPDERGFLHPEIDQSLCVNCGKCENVCPQQHMRHLNPEGTIYAALTVDDELRSHSSSGGLFSVLAESILKKGGVVFGAALQADLSVRHIAVDSLDQLHLLRGSKYVQSEIGKTYQEAKEKLNLGQNVLFSGTPCQIAGLYSYLGKNDEKLLTVDILCHGVPSPSVFKKYIMSNEAAADSKLKKVNFRKKDPGWTSFSTELEYENGIETIDNSYYYLFVWNYTLRKSCNNCRYAQTSRIGDITLGDFWGYKESRPEHIEDDDLGISFVSVNTEKGRTAFNQIKKRIDCAPRRIDDALKGNLVLSQACIPNENAVYFWDDFPTMSWDELVEKYQIPREKRKDPMIPEDRRYYSIPYKKRHKRHLIHCAKEELIKILRNKERQ